MSDIWFTSDSHFGHANIIAFKDAKGALMRPGFSDITHMDETIIANWNAVVKPDDKVYHLGDVAMRQAPLDAIMPRLNGRKRLILGNHDTLPLDVYKRHFQKIMAWRQFTDGDVGLYCTHFPVHMSAITGRSGSHVVRVNVHGHIHAQVIADPRYINICVEQTGYAPVSYDWLLRRARKAAAKPHSHQD
jgi:calcineurin-like phosphoesterase family protein